MFLAKVLFSLFLNRPLPEGFINKMSFVCEVLLEGDLPQQMSNTIGKKREQHIRLILRASKAIKPLVAGIYFVGSPKFSYIPIELNPQIKIHGSKQPHQLHRI